MDVAGGTGAGVCCDDSVDVCCCCCCSCSARYSASSASESEKEEVSPNLPPPTLLPPGMPPTALSSKSALDMEAR